MISAKKAFAAIAAVGFSAAMAPAQALPARGQAVPAAQALEELKNDQWEPLFASWGGIGEEAQEPAEEDTIESTMAPARPVFMILNKKDTDQWAAAVKKGDEFMLIGQGTNMKLTPLDNTPYKTVSYNVPVQNMPGGMPPVDMPGAGPGAGQAAPKTPSNKLCGPSETFDDAMTQAFNAVKIMTGVDEDGDSVSFFAVPKSDFWTISVGTESGMTCAENMGNGYAVNPARPEFVPEWRRNIMAP